MCITQNGMNGQIGAPMFVMNYDDPCKKLNDFDTNIHHQETTGCGALLNANNIWKITAS